MHAHETELKDAIKKYIEAHTKLRDSKLKEGASVPDHDFTKEEMVAMELATLKFEVVMLLSDIDSLVSTQRVMGRSGMQVAVLRDALRVVEDRVTTMRQHGI